MSGRARAALALFLGGLASGLHCAGMCGGISAGFSLLQKEQLWKRQLAFNAGRITSYAAAGAAAGALGSAGAYAAAVLPAQTLLYFFSSAFVLLAGMHLWGVAAAAVRAGTARHAALAAPAAARRAPATRAHAAAGVRRRAGVGLAAVRPGLRGACSPRCSPAAQRKAPLAMAAFGAGTLPWLFVAGVAAARLRGWSGLRGCAGWAERSSSPSAASASRTRAASARASGRRSPASDCSYPAGGTEASPRWEKSYGSARSGL